jgi:hypothetical protein
VFLFTARTEASKNGKSEAISWKHSLEVRNTQQKVCFWRCQKSLTLRHFPKWQWPPIMCLVLRI